MSNEWRTLKQESQRVHVSEATMRREIRAGKLRNARVGGRKSIRLRPEWTDAWLLSTSTPVER
jgi:hypothetical protein